MMQINCFVFNKVLAWQKENYQAGGKFIGYVAIAKFLTEWHNSHETAWLAEAPVLPGMTVIVF